MTFWSGPGVSGGCAAGEAVELAVMAGALLASAACAVWYDDAWNPVLNAVQPPSDHGTSGDEGESEVVGPEASRPGPAVSDKIMTTGLSIAE